MNTNIESKGTEPQIASRLVKCLLAPALIALFTLGMHCSVLGSVSGSEPQAASQEAEIDHLPAAYAFRAIDFDD